MKMHLKTILVAGFVGLIGVAQAEFRASDHDGFQRPKEKKSTNTSEDTHKKMPAEIDHDGVQAPQSKKSKDAHQSSSPANKADTPHQYHEYDGFKRPKKEN